MDGSVKCKLPSTPPSTVQLVNLLLLVRCINHSTTPTLKSMNYSIEMLKNLKKFIKFLNVPYLLKLVSELHGNIKDIHEYMSSRLCYVPVLQIINLWMTFVVSSE